MTEAQLTPAGPDRWALAGVLDFTTVTRLATEGETLLRAASARGIEALEIDLSGVELANSAGLALLLEWLEMARAQGLRLCYRQLPVSLQRIAAVSNLRELLPLAN